MAIPKENRTTTVILVGAGHVHLYVAAHAEEFLQRGARVVLIDPGEFWYSGMATGMLGGMYEAVEDQVNPQALIESHGGDYRRDRVEAIQPSERRVKLAGGVELAYDYLSLNLGSQVDVAALPDARGDSSVWSVKPISNLWKLREHLETRFQAGEFLRVAVIGGGPTGTEVAANVLALAARHHSKASITLVTASDRLLTQISAAAVRKLQHRLFQRGLTIRTRIRVVRREGAALIADDGSRIEADVVVLATGLQASSLVHETGLPTDSQNGLRVNAKLHSIADDRVFAGGDCAALEGFDLPRLGVFGVRQAKCIHANLLASLNRLPLMEYKPQHHYLAIMNLGDGTALATWGPFWWNGRASMWLKDTIDRRFLARYRKLGQAKRGIV